MDDFREGLRYDPNKKQIKGRTTRKSKQYRAKQAMRQRIMALALTGSIAIGAVGIGTAIKNKIDAKEAKYVSNIGEMQKYNINAQDLQISPETYEHIMSLTEELDVLEENDFEEISNIQIADYFDEMADLYLSVLKQKVATVTGMSIDEFTLVAPSAHGTETVGTQVKDPDMMFGVGVDLKSKEIYDYMIALLDARDYAYSIANEDVNRSKLTNKLMDYKEQLGEIATLNLLREMSGKEGYTKLISYRIETRGLQQQTETEKLASKDQIYDIQK